MEHKGIESPNDINENSLTKMSREFDIVGFFEKYKGYIGLILITPFQVVIAYGKKSDNLEDHYKLLIKVKALLERDNDWESVLFLRLANIEKSMEDDDIALENYIIKEGEEFTYDMLKVVELLNKKVYSLVEKIDIDFNDMKELIKKLEKGAIEKPSGIRKIIGIPIGHYIEYLEGKRELVIDGENR